MLNHHRESRVEVLAEVSVDLKRDLKREGLGAYLRRQGSGLFYFDGNGFNRWVLDPH